MITMSGGPTVVKLLRRCYTGERCETGAKIIKLSVSGYKKE